MTTRDVIFARNFMILTWNLMSRASSTLAVCLNHIEFVDDALCIYFPKMKNDQLGERPKDPRYVYANPKKPHVCPLLALGMYWLCYDFESNQRLLFHGNKQYERFRKVLVRVLREMTSPTRDDKLPAK
jgi:hypothetical protein